MGSLEQVWGEKPHVQLILLSDSLQQYQHWWTLAYVLPDAWVVTNEMEQGPVLFRWKVDMRWIEMRFYFTNLFISLPDVLLCQNGAEGTLKELCKNTLIERNVEKLLPASGGIQDTCPLHMQCESCFFFAFQYWTETFLQGQRWRFLCHHRKPDCKSYSCHDLVRLQHDQN